MDLTEDEVIHEAHKLYMRNQARERRHNDDEYRKKLNARSNEYQKIQYKISPEYRDKQARRAKEYSNRPEVKLKLKEKYTNTYNSRRDVFFKILGYSCKICGFNDKRALQIDHIFNDGGVHFFGNIIRL
jgi:hypothetical protein